MSVLGSVISVDPKLAPIGTTLAGLNLVVPLPNAGDADCKRKLNVFTVAMLPSRRVVYGSRKFTNIGLFLPTTADPS
jgi:hypothetical protein